MTARTTTVNPARRPHRRTTKPNIVKLIPGKTPLPLGSRIEGGRR
jgi:hypothetical protein